MDSRVKIMVSAVVQSIVTLYEEFQSVLTSDDDSSSDDDEYQRRPRKRRRTADQVSRIRSFMKFTVPRFTDAEFQSHFRLSVNAFEWLLNKIGPKLERKRTVGRLSTCPKKQLLSVLWLFATPDSFGSVACRFDMSKGTLHACFLRVLDALNCLAMSVIVWPNAEKRKLISEGFERLGGLKGVVGAIAGTYVKIKAPTDDAQVYNDRKCFYGITLQAICDDNLQFIDCFAGYPSSVSDNRIFRQSEIYKAIINNTSAYFSPHEYIIGDKAYETTAFCLPPYREGNNFTEWQRKFNHLHAKTRQIIERTFALFFGRFRRFKDLDMSRTDLIPASIIAACVLHNICLNQSFDLLRGQFETEGVVYLQHRAANERAAGQQRVTPLSPTNSEGRIFRDQVALEMGLLNDN